MQTKITVMEYTISIDKRNNAQMAIFRVLQEFGMIKEERSTTTTKGKARKRLSEREKTLAAIKEAKEGKDIYVGSLSNLKKMAQ